MNNAPMKPAPLHSDLHLEPFTKENADLVLSWRNSEQVRTHSLNDEPIDYLDHLNFVEQRQGHYQRQFFIVRIKGAPVGVLNVNLEQTTGYWGCYLADDRATEPRPGIFPLLIGIAGVVAFECLGCTELQSTVLQSNSAPQKMNAFLGIPITDVITQQRSSGQEINVIHYSLKQQHWPVTLEKLMTVLTRYHQGLLLHLQHNGCDTILYSRSP